MTGFSNTRLALSIIAFAALAMGIWTGCTVGFDVAQEEKFPCTDDDDCIQGFECGPADLCRERKTGSGPECTDDDGDGYGVGETIEERQGCPQCENFGRCDEDCNDSDPAINPGAVEQCNGIDDNCNDTPDDPTPCTENADCSELEGPPNTQPQCDMNSGTCQIFMTTKICRNGATPCPCNSQPQMCTGGQYPMIPEPSTCLQ